MSGKKDIEATKKLVSTIQQAIDEKHGEQITLFDFTGMPNSITDYFVVCHVATPPQVEAIMDHVIATTIKTLRSKPWKVEGVDNKEWVLLDYVDVVVHIFREEVRHYYNIDGLWGDLIVNHL